MWRKTERRALRTAPFEPSRTVTGWSKDLEMLETTHPADYQSIELTDAQIARLK